MSKVKEGESGFTEGWLSVALAREASILVFRQVLYLFEM